MTRLTENRYKKVVDASFFEFVLAAGWIGIGLRYLSGAERTPLAVLNFGLQWMAPVWGVLYVVGSLSILLGLFRPAPRMRVFGLWLMATAFASIAIALAWDAPNTRVGLYVVNAAACVYVARPKKVVVIPVKEDL